MERCGIIALLLVGLSAVDAARLNHRSTCGVKGASNSSRIENGADASECEWRWQVALWNDKFSKPTCGGMLISMEWVLTAAHCLWEFPRFDAIAGMTDIYGSEHKQSRKVVQQFVYPNWWLSLDLALLRLETPMVPDACVGTICLPTQGADVAPGSTCWITGWGQMGEDGIFADVLQEAEMKVMSNEDCSAAYEGSFWGSESITPSAICAQGMSESGGVTSACVGDNGAPLVCESAGEWTAYGAHSWGYCSTREVYPGVWTRIHEAIDWIDETLAANTAPPPPLETCPDFAYSSVIDELGECECPPGQFCSTNGFNANCPQIPSFGGSIRPEFFFWHCSDCMCYPEL